MCALFDTSKYFAPKPDIVATASGTTITIAVTLYRQDLANTGVPVYHNLNTAEAGSNVCRTTSDNAVPTADANWVHTSSTGCSDTYTLSQTLVEIVGSANNNNWQAALAADGRSITYTTPLYSTYSVNAPDGCYFVGYRSVISFRTQLSVASTSGTFITADNSAQFKYSGIRITSSNNLEIYGKITPLIPNSELRNIAMKKTSNSVVLSATTTTCTTYNVACDEVYSVAVASLGAAGTDIGGQYDNTMDVFENNVKTRTVVLSYTLSYIIPGNPTVVDSSTISLNNQLYTDNTYSTIRTASYASGNDKLYIENGVSAGPAIPANFKLRFDRGYVCCVNYLSAISPYDQNTDTGGCKDSAGKLEYVNLGTAPSGVTQITAETVGNNKKYRVQVDLSAVYSTVSHADPMSCQVLLISKFEAPAARRAESANTDGTFVATVPFLIEASGARAVGISVVAILVVLFNMLL
jgi:hypothetical protein